MTNDTTTAPIGADALRVAAQAALTALENLHEIDTETECITIDVRDEIDALRAALASAAQPVEAVAYGLEAWVDGAWHLQWPLRPTEADAEKDRAMYSADAKLRLVRLSAAAPQASPAAQGDALDAAFEAVRQRLCRLPRYSFLTGPGGSVSKVQDKTGRWLGFQEAHALFDPVAVDAARAAKEGDKS